MYLLLTITTLLSSWLFAPEDSTRVMPADSQFVVVTLPHDWAINSQFDRENDLQEVQIIQNGETQVSRKTGRTGGLNWMGAAWYKYYLTEDDLKDSTKLYSLYFDGAMSHAEIYVNGIKAGEWVYGYNAFEVDITPFIPFDSLYAVQSQRQAYERAIEKLGISGNESRIRAYNAKGLLPQVKDYKVEVAVRLDNRPESSRWYPGAGLYRRVELHTCHKTHVPLWGTCIRAKYVTDWTATVQCDVEVENPTEEMTVITTLYYKDHAIAYINGLHGSAAIRQPMLWTPETPNMYEARTVVRIDGAVVDTYSTRFGLRRVEYIPGIGFMLNGKVRKFQGVCLHHDLGPLGAATYRDAIRHQISMLKDMGCDAIRTSHNMPSQDLVELCEDLGVMLLIEPFDEWTMPKCKNGYTNHFIDWVDRDMLNMLRHFRNSPALMLWSIGNEVGEQRMDSGYVVADYLQKICHYIDPTRPVTCGMDQVAQVIRNPFAATLDIPGFNYRTGRYQEAHDSLPNRLILGTETASTVSSRGVYKFPAQIEANKLWTDNQCSSYDLEYCAWSGLPDQDFQLQDDYDWTIGQFVWTGFDYLGEPSPYDTDAWPSHSSYFGIIDLASIPKDRFYLYRSHWNQKKHTLHILPHWTWPGREGKRTPVFVYTSYPSAELFVNGESQGRLRFATREEAEAMREGAVIEGVSAMPQVGIYDVPGWGTEPRPDLLPRYRLMWQDVQYQPGELKVVAYDRHGRPAAQQVIKTAKKPKRMHISWANKDEATEEGLCYLTVTITDGRGNLCPDADNEITIQVKNGDFIAAANGDATCTIGFNSATMKAFHGQCTFIVRRGTKTNQKGEVLKTLVTFQSKELNKKSILL